MDIYAVYSFASPLMQATTRAIYSIRLGHNYNPNTVGSLADA